MYYWKWLQGPSKNPDSCTEVGGITFFFPLNPAQIKLQTNTKETYRYLTFETTNTALIWAENTMFVLETDSEEESSSSWTFLNHDIINCVLMLTEAFI